MMSHREHSCQALVAVRDRYRTPNTSAVGNGSDRMTFICFIESSASRVPHMEALDASTLDEARLQTRRLLSQHSRARLARIFFDAVEVEVLPVKAPPC